VNTLHKLAEYADWYSWPPRKMWRRLLAWCDRRWGFNCTHEDPPVGAWRMKPKKENSNA
jgi:hypothetical protein